MQIHVMLVLTITIVSVPLVSTMEQFANDEKLEPELYSAMEANETANIFILFEYKEHEVKEAVNKLRGQKLSRTGKANAVTDILLRLAEVQGPVLSILSDMYMEEQCNDFESIWISNEIYVEAATLQLIKFICQRTEVEKLRLAGMASGKIPGVVTDHIKKSRDGADTWGIDRIQARQAVQVPGYIFNNQVVVASIDSGVNGQHESLVQSYIGGKYGWLDAVGLSHQVNDVAGHGTHTIGTVLGGGGIGVAPNAKWMACAAMLSTGGNCPFFALLRCAQFVLNPARWRGAHCGNLSPTVDEEDIANQIIPNIVLCCWLCKTPFFSFYFAIQAWKEAGIIPVFAAGNSMSATVDKPAWNQIYSPGDSPFVITVGNLQYDFKLAPSSCLGPATYDLIGTKPDLVAPGTDVYSASCNSSNTYTYDSGTSMAAPHVAGVIALILAFNDRLTFPEVKRYLTEEAWQHNLEFPTGEEIQDPQDGEAVDPKDRETEDPKTKEIEFPNYAVGYGLVNAFNSIVKLVESTHSE